MIKKSKLLFLAALLTMPTTLLAQDEPMESELLPIVDTLERSALFPQPGDWGVLVNVNGLVGNITANPRPDLLGNSSLVLRYTHSPRVTFRLGLAPQITRNRVLSTDSVNTTLVEFDSTTTRSQFSLRPGVEFHLKGSKRIDPYVAVDAELGLVGQLSIGSVTDVTDTTGTSRTIRTITEDGGYTLGARLSFGANYFVTQNFFLGMEYGLGVNSLITGGDRQDVVQIEPVSGANTTIRDLSSARSSNLNFAVDPTVQITIGYFFGW